MFLLQNFMNIDGTTLFLFTFVRAWSQEKVETYAIHPKAKVQLCNLKPLKLHSCNRISLGMSLGEKTTSKHSCNRSWKVLLSNHEGGKNEKHTQRTLSQVHLFFKLGISRYVSLFRSPWAVQRGWNVVKLFFQVSFYLIFKVF